MHSPFQDLSTDFYDRINLEQPLDAISFIRQTFVSDSSIVQSFLSKQHSFIWGSRGTGKSTLLKYYALTCQLCDPLDWPQYKANPDNIIGIYIPIKRGMFEESKYAQLNEFLGTQIAQHYFNVMVCEKIVNELSDSLKKTLEIYNHNDILKFKNHFMDLLGASEKIRLSHDNDLSPFDFMLDFFSSEKLRIADYIRYGQFGDYENKIPCCITDYFNFIFPFIQLVKDLLDIHKPIYLMFDDAGHLPEKMQAYLNLWIANRDNFDLVIKATANPLRYNNFYTTDGFPIEVLHDYTQIELDYTKRIGVATFRTNAIKIAKNRLVFLDYVQTEPEMLFPMDSEYEKLIKDTKEEARKQIEESNNTYIDPQRQITRASHILLAKKIKKGQRKYAGLINIIYLSSNNYRSFLEIANEIMIAVPERNRCQTNIIDSNIQQKAILKYSQRKIDDIIKYKSSVDKSLAVKARNLIHFLCSICKHRMINGFVECNVTSFTILGNINRDLDEVLGYCVEERYLIDSVPYRNKKGTTLNKVYSLNKIYLPSYNLDPVPAAGRIQIKSNYLIESITDASVALRGYIQNSKNKFDIMEEVDIDEEDQ